MSHLKLEIKVKPGTEIRTACEEVKLLSEFVKEELYFKFNDVHISTDGKSINDMVDNYLKQR